MFLALLAFARLRFGKGVIRMVRLPKMNLVNGIAPIVEDQTVNFQPKWMKILERFLDFL
jgi:hypothetical protein